MEIERKNCLQCKQSFAVVHGKQSTCSPECKKKLQYARVMLYQNARNELAKRYPDEYKSIISRLKACAAQEQVGGSKEVVKAEVVGVGGQTPASIRIPNYRPPEVV